jgi:N4-(beta-N-acetylglucosaminyl)-L-asparaginase
VYKNGGAETAVARAFGMITRGADVLDALVDGVTIVELDPAETGVGWSGLPNADGVVQLDSCCMHGLRRRAGGVAALEGVRTPAKVAQLVADQTDHHLIVGKGAQEFARAMGFKIEEGLIGDRAREQWLEWKRRTDPLHYLDPKTRSEAWYETGLQMVREGLLDSKHYWGTINCNGITPRGDIAGVTTTSGLAWKIPGRVGDSPILGAGLYVDNAVGAAGSTGRGEANLYNLCSYLVVEEMRRGAHPKDAAVTALRRVVANTTEKRLLNKRGTPNFGLSFYVLNANGDFAAVSMYAGNYAVCTENGPETRKMEALFPGAATD